MVRGVWVVPVGRLVEWLAGRPRLVEDDALHRLSTLVMTEFPSTTTDPQLLAAIGADLQRRAGVSRSRRSGRRLGAPASAAASPPGRRGPAPKRPPGKRWKGAIRPLLVLAGAALFWWAMTHGVVDAVTQMAGRALSERILESVGGGGPDGLSCEDFDPGAAKVLRGVELTGVPLSTGCEWQVVSNAGEKLPALRLREVKGAMEQLERSREAGVPDIHTSPSLTGETTVFSVASGVRLSSSTRAPEATRSMTVQVSHEALGLTARQGRRLAADIARAASRRHDPVPAQTT